MKRSSIIMYSGILFVVLTLVMTASGCMNGAGETKAEIARRHDHVLKTNMLLVQEDVDAILMLDRPSRNTRKFVRP